MKFSATLISVKDIEKSKAFYKKVLGLNVVSDFGANVTLDGGVVLQTAETWKSFIGEKEIISYNNAFELYFEEDDFDSFLRLLNNMDIEYVHKLKEHSWGQRVVRFYDPDGHIIEVGENMIFVVKRFSESSMTPTQISERMDVPIDFVNECLNS